MVKLISALLLLSVMSASAVNEWKVVFVKGGEAVSVASCYSGSDKIIDPSKNEYPSDYAFPAEDMMYWKKVGNDWVAMDAGEKLAVDEAKKQKALDDAVANVDMEALLKCIAESIKNNDKTFEAVKANFKASVDPKKQDKKEKGK